MENIKLTQYLYNYEEVKLSFIYSILTKQDILEVYYWFFELYYTNDDDQNDTLYNLIYQIYYDYYYSLNPEFETFINDNILIWENFKKKNYINNENNNNENNNNENKSKNINTKIIIEEPIFKIIINMHNLQHNYDLFIIRQIYNYQELCQTYIYNSKRKGRIPNYLKEYDTLYHNLFYWIANTKWVNICYYLKHILKKSNNHYYCYTYINNFCIKYFKKYDNDIIKYNNYYFNHQSYHAILTNIYKFTNLINIYDISKINFNNNNTNYLSPNIKHIQFIINHMNKYNDIPTNKDGETLTYKILSYKRLYYLYDIIGSFKLQRFNIDFNTYKKLHYYNWEYHASMTNIWKNRINKFNGKISNIDKKITFENHDDHDKFYNMYDYEFDEQPQIVQNLSLRNIIKLHPCDWINNIINKNYNIDIINYNIENINYINTKFNNQDKNDIINTFKEINLLTI